MRHRNVELHRDWMLRSDVIAVAFTGARGMLPCLRAFVEVPPDPLADDIQAAIAWACWMVPLFVLEVVFACCAAVAGDRSRGRANRAI